MSATEPRYFIIWTPDGGDSSLEGPLTEAEVLKRITPDKDGETWHGRGIGFADRVPTYLSSIAGKQVLIIKGEIVLPQVVQKVVEYKLP